MLQMPKIIARYIEATNAHNVDQVMNCFAKNAVVRDVGENLEMKGIVEIQKWIERITREYNLQLKPINVSVRDENIEVITEVAGSFSGSPLEFRYEFILKDDLIVFLSTSLK